MYSKILSATPLGVEARAIEVEADLSFGLVNFFIVGLPDTAIRESSKRILSALKNSGVRIPPKKITINLAPADLQKEGSLFDLPIAIAIIAASEKLALPENFFTETLFVGELSLEGAIRPIRGTFIIAHELQKLGKKRLIIPQANVAEAAFIEDIEIIGCSHIQELIAYLRGERKLPVCSINQEALIAAQSRFHTHQRHTDFSSVVGQKFAKRGLQIAAAGRHHTLLIGAPGSGKTMLARALCTIMPDMSKEEIIETSKIYSASTKSPATPLVVSRPFRSPHHTISTVGLIGGGTYPQPGEITLAHNGILFLDEATEFKRVLLESLRQPLEEKEITIVRARFAIVFPADFMLVAALNPCPCGFWGDERRTCSCTPPTVKRYFGKLSGPLLDRIDLHIHVPSVPYEIMQKAHSESETSEQLFLGVKRALQAQKNRFGTHTIFNSTMTEQCVKKYCSMTPEAETILERGARSRHMSMRGRQCILKIARTIADIEAEEYIQPHHIQEAFMYRSLENIYQLA